MTRLSYGGRWAAVVLLWAVVVGAESDSVSFRGRQIDLQPFYGGFPYGGVRPSLATDELYYFRYGQTHQLMKVDLYGGRVDLAAGRPLTDVDFSRRSAWAVGVAGGAVYWIGDERNDEITALYRLGPDGAPQRLTDTRSIGGWSWDPHERRIAYVAWEEGRSELRVFDVENDEERTVLRDEPGMRFTRMKPVWRPDGRGIALAGLADFDRNRGNVLFVDLDGGEPALTVLTDPDRKRPNYGLVGWVGDVFLYLSNEAGFANIYRRDTRVGTRAQVTSFVADVRDWRLVEVGGRILLLCVVQWPTHNELVLVDPLAGDVLHRNDYPLNITLLDAHGDRVLAQATSVEVPFAVFEIAVGERGVSLREKVAPPESVRRQIHARVEKTSFPTFDTDPATGRPRMLHGYLYHPLDPLPAQEGLGVVLAWNGGANAFNPWAQLFCAAGIYVFGPTPRGAWGFGQAFEALNDGDMGGGETLDLIWAARYLGARTGLEEPQIGAFGYSMGGYQTLRLLTFPGRVNGIEARFDWGFGISTAGFSDLARMAETSNMGDYLNKEAGDPRSEAAKLRDRSPVAHAAGLKARLLVAHGANDNRVPVGQSRLFIAELERLGKEVSYIEYAGQGHAIRGRDMYRSWLEFLQGLGGRNPAVLPQAETQ